MEDDNNNNSKLPVDASVAAPAVADGVHLVETIIARYRGPARIQRLQWFLSRQKGGKLQPCAAVDAALTGLVATAQAAGNVHCYQGLFDQYGSSGGKLN